MARRKAEVYIASLLLAAVIVIVNLVVTNPFTFLVTLRGGVEELKVWERSAEEYYVFLPGSASLGQVRIRTAGGMQLDGQRFSDGMSCETLELNRPYALSSWKQSGTITFLQSKNIGTMWIDTVSGNTRYIRKTKGNKEPGSFRLYTPEGELDAEGTLNYIKARGNSTFTYAAKKAYSLELSQDADLLGMGKAKKWILLADAFDPSHLRNKIVFDYAEAAGLAFTPACRWVDVYLNGAYEGLYLLTERNELAPNRVEVPGPTFLVSAEAPERMEEQDLPHITLDSGTTLRIHGSDFSPQDLHNLWQSAENAILAEDGVDPVTGKHWTDLIDLDSWARKYLLEEIFGNYDGGRQSQFYYLDREKIYAGPAWDYDYAMVSSYLYNVPAPNMIYVNQPEERNGSLWFFRLCQNADFYDYVLDLYQTEFRPLLENLSERDVYEYGEIVSRAAWLDQTRWGTASPEEDAAVVRSFLSDRLEFLDGFWIQGRDCIPVDANCAGIQANYMVFPGDTLPPLPEREGYAWYLAGTDILFDHKQPIWEEISIELREIS